MEPSSGIRWLLTAFSAEVMPVAAVAISAEVPLLRAVIRLLNAPITFVPEVNKVLPGRVVATLKESPTLTLFVLLFPT